MRASCDRVPKLSGGGAGLTPDANPRIQRGQLTAESKIIMRSRGMESVEWFPLSKVRSTKEPAASDGL